MRLAGIPDACGHFPTLHFEIKATRHPRCCSKPGLAQAILPCVRPDFLQSRDAGAPTWSSVLTAGERPPCTQKMRLSMSADKLLQPHTSLSVTYINTVYGAPKPQHVQVSKYSNANMKNCFWIRGRGQCNT